MRTTLEMTCVVTVLALVGCGGQSEEKKKNPSLGCVKSSELCDGLDNDCNGVVDDCGFVCDCIKDEDCKGMVECNGSTEACKDHECVVQTDKCPTGQACDVESGECAVAECIIDRDCINTGQEGRYCEPGGHTCVDCYDNSHCLRSQTCELNKCMNCPDDGDACTLESLNSECHEQVPGCCNLDSECANDKSCTDHICKTVECADRTNECLRAEVSDHETCGYVRIEDCCIVSEDCADPDLKCDVSLRKCVECLDGFDCGFELSCDSHGECVTPECPPEDDDTCTEFVFAHNACTQERVSADCCHVDNSNDCDDQLACIEGSCVAPVCPPDDDNVCTRNVVSSHSCVSVPVRNCCQSTADCRLGGECVDHACTKCAFSSDCDDGIWCNGTESCVDSHCRPGARQCLGGEMTQCDEAQKSCHECINSDVQCQGQVGSNQPFCVERVCATCRDDRDCPNRDTPYCDPVGHTCVDCVEDAQCNDNKWCSGVETCVQNVCTPGVSPCASLEQRAEYPLICYEDATLQKCVECLESRDSCVCIDNMCKQCLTDTDCSDRSDGRRLCDQNSNMCIGCRSDNDCDGYDYCSVEHVCEPVYCPDDMELCLKGVVVDHMCYPIENLSDSGCCVPGDDRFCQNVSPPADGYMWACSTQKVDGRDWHWNVSQHHKCTTGIDENQDKVCGTVELCGSNNRVDDNCDGIVGEWGRTYPPGVAGCDAPRDCDWRGTTIRFKNPEFGERIKASGGSNENADVPSWVFDEKIDTSGEVIGNTCAVQAFAEPFTNMGLVDPTPEVKLLACQYYMVCTNYSGEDYPPSLVQSRVTSGQTSLYVCSCTFDGAVPLPPSVE